jgi:hypothetical protein
MNLFSRGAVCAGVVAMIAVAELASAQQPTSAQQSAIRQACRSDYQAVCASVPTGGSAALQCLKQNAANVSAPCQQALAAGGGGAAPTAAPPAAAGAPAASAAAAPAMAAPSAGAPRMSPREEIAMVRGACGQDYRTYCQNVQLGGGRAITCLEANGTSLSPACQRALMAAKQRM